MKRFWLLFIIWLFCSSFVTFSYSSEEKAAYTWAYNNWITTMTTIDKANMNWEVTRIALAKMISNYAIKTLKKKWDTSKKCVFTDVTSDLDKQYDNWVTNACQLWLMGQWITKFRPYDPVTRAEFWTILSRLLYWDKYNWWNPYYKNHLNNLRNVWIMTNISNPDSKNETRGNVMVMLKRSKDWSVKTITTSTPTTNDTSTTNIKVPSYDELDQKTSISCLYVDEFDGDKYNYSLRKNSMILPYKDWYFSYDYGWTAGLWFYLHYRLNSNMCEIYISSDSIFRIPYHNSYDAYNKLYYHDWEDLEYEDLIKNPAELAKTLNCDPKDQEWCLKEADKYVYDLLVWKESNEYFTLWMNELKRRIDKNEVKTVDVYYKYGYDERSSLFYKCRDVTREEFDSKNSDGWKYSLEKGYCLSAGINKYCRYKYINACSNWVDCEKLKSELNKC